MFPGVEEKLRQHLHTQQHGQEVGKQHSQGKMKMYMAQERKVSSLGPSLKYTHFPG